MQIVKRPSEHFSNDQVHYKRRNFLTSTHLHYYIKNVIGGVIRDVGFEGLFYDISHQS